jgi:hypothetical protein
LAAVGATDADPSVGDVSPLDRLISGDAQAAVLKLLYPDAAEAFPDIEGFKVRRVPLPPHWQKREATALALANIYAAAGLVRFSGLKQISLKRLT